MVRFQHEYERAGLQLWTNDRITRLAASLGVTLWTLFAWAGAFVPIYDIRRDLVRLQLDEKLIQKCWHANHWPTLLVVNLERIEQFQKTRDHAPDGMLMGTIDNLAVSLLNNTETQNG